MAKRYYIVLGKARVAELAACLVQDRHTVEAVEVLHMLGRKKSAQHFFGSILLPTGAKIGVNTGSTKKGAYVISGYAHDCADIAPYKKFGKVVRF